MDLSKEKKDIHHQIDYVRFDFYNPDEVKRISVQNITEPIAFDNLPCPVKGGIHDELMGVSAFDRTSPCKFCGLENNKCVGHFGHIELAAPVYNPFMFNYLLKTMNSKCFNCHRLKMKIKNKLYIFMKLILIKLGLLNEATSLYSLINTSLGDDNNEIKERVAKFLTRVGFNLNNLNFVGEENNSLIDVDISIGERGSHDSLDSSLLVEEEAKQNSKTHRHGSIDTTTNTDNTDDTNQTNQLNNGIKSKGHKSKKKKKPTEEEKHIEDLENRKIRKY